jgi:hemoglobin
MAKKQQAATKKPGASKISRATKPTTTQNAAATPSRVARKEPVKPSLYERLGGVYAIAVVVDDFIDRLMVDPRINDNAKVDEAHHRVPPPGFKYLVTEQVCWASGGPQKYTGRSMRDSHAHLAITPGEWEAFLDDLRQTLDKFGVPKPERKELFAIVESTRADIVVEK